VEEQLLHEALSWTYMPLQVSKPAVAAEKAVCSMLGRIIAPETDYVSALQSAAPTSLAISTPHRLAFLALDRIRAGMSLRSAAQKKGWRFFVHRGDKIVATINSTVNSKGRHVFSNITEGPFVLGTAEAIKRAERLESVQKGHFEIVLLQVPAIHIVALWLINLEDDADLIIPISPTPRGVRAYRAVSTAKFIVKIANLAAHKRQEYKEFRRGGR
jgi:hypothetical protein